MSMEHNGSNPNLSSVTLCRMGCGFYGNATFEGMCSKCYKDTLKRRQQTSSPTQMSGRVSPNTMSSSTSTELPSSSTESRSGTPSPTPVDTSTTPSVETATPTVPTTSVGGEAKEKLEESLGAEASVSSASSESDDSSSSDKKPKKSRCHMCKKKIGLTGFQCRCGGMYCSMHRYSDKHECTFNYKEMAQLQIRKNNPVVVGAKIQKI